MQKILFTLTLTSLITLVSASAVASTYDNGQYYTATDVANYQNNYYSGNAEKSEGVNVKQKTNPFTGKSVSNSTVLSRTSTKNLLK